MHLSGSCPQSPVNGEVPGGEAGVERGMVKSESQLKTFMKLWHQMRASWGKRSQWGKLQGPQASPKLFFMAAVTRGLNGVRMTHHGSYFSRRFRDSAPLGHVD